MSAAIIVENLSKSFGKERKALDGVSLRVQPGEMVALIGASGSGKSTLLRHMCGLLASDRRPGCRVEVFGRSVQSGGRLARDIRDVRAGIGFVFQQFNLVGRLPVITNVLAGTLHRIPLRRSLVRRFTDEELRRGIEALARVGIAECAFQRASTLSGGQQQRAAISRALVQEARVILADEPIASLDPESSRRVMELLAVINRELGVTVLVSLHQVDYAMRYCPRTVALRGGRVVFDGPSAMLTPQRLRKVYGAQAEEILSHEPVVPETAGDGASRARGRAPAAESAA